MSRIVDSPGAPPTDADEQWRALLERLYKLSRKGMILGLDRVAGLLAQLGDPQRRFRAVHVAGTNGKGSTAAYCATILSQAGLRVGLFTSPHLVCLTERIQLLEDGRRSEVSREALRAAVATVEAVDPGFQILTFFEVITAAAFLVMADRGVEVAVVECGMGARLDATRLVEAEVTVLTPIALDHTEYLGDTLEAVAGEKAAAIRRGRALVCARQPAAAEAVIRAAAAAASAPTFRVGDEIDLRAEAPGVWTFQLAGRVVNDVRPALGGGHQGANALLAAQAASLILPDLEDAAIRRGLARTYWPGRMELIRRPGRPLLLLDGAHNPAAARALADGVREACGDGPLHFVVAMMVDKDSASTLSQLEPMASSLTLTRVQGERAAEPEALLAQCPADHAPARVVPDPIVALAAAETLATADGGSVVVCGSLYLVGLLRQQVVQ